MQSVKADALILRVGGVGYEVFYTDATPLAGEPLSIHIFDYIREDRRELYGFLDEGMRDLFERMIDISGIGPRMAQKILRVGPREKLYAHIQQGDVAFLTQVPGVGTKTAQKIILELQGVLISLEDVPAHDTDTVDALMSLGYTRVDAQQVVAQLSSQATEDRIREALQLLGT